MTEESGERIIFASDHGGVALKKALLECSRDLGFSPVDMGTQSRESVDYPDIVARAVAMFEERSAHYMVLVCGSGLGVCMAANRFCKMRAFSTDNPFLARLARQHNHANCLCLGERIIGVGLAMEVMKVFLGAEQDSSERHARRVEKLGLL